jgi:hypothetical protein
MRICLAELKIVCLLIIVNFEIFIWPIHRLFGVLFDWLSGLLKPNILASFNRILQSKLLTNRLLLELINIFRISFKFIVWNMWNKKAKKFEKSQNVHLKQLFLRTKQRKCSLVTNPMTRSSPGKLKRSLSTALHISDQESRKPHYYIWGNW